MSLFKGGERPNLKMGQLTMVLVVHKKHGLNKK